MYQHIINIMPPVYYQAFQEFATFLLGYKIVLQNPSFSFNATITHGWLEIAFFQVYVDTDNFNQQHVFNQRAFMFELKMII